MSPRPPVRGLRQCRAHVHLDMWPCRMVRSEPWTGGWARPRAPACAPGCRHRGIARGLT